ncbi:MAG: NAD-binding protein [Polynucleobacter sp.]|nr:NAD-binding protein [Polynucleobacter sp.]
MLGKPVNTTVVVVGGGTMGADVASVCARGGCKTRVVETEAERRNRLPNYFTKRMSEMGYEKRLPLLSTAASLKEVQWSDVDLVIECVPERLDIKQALFSELEKLANPETVLSSNSSSFPISAIAEGLKTSQRMIGLHFFMPAHLVPCVEVVYGKETLPEVADGLSQLMTACGMVPVIVKKDLPGFLANRLQHALSREAFYLVDQGIASLEDIDKAVRFGFGFRYLAAGPVLQRDHAGLDIHSAAGASIYPSLNNSPEIANCLKQRAEQGKFGMKAGEGFFPWNPDTIEAERKRYNAILMASLEIIRKELPKIE